MNQLLLHWKYRVNGPVAFKGGGTTTQVQQNYSPEESYYRQMVMSQAANTYAQNGGSGAGSATVPVPMPPGQTSQQANQAALSAIPASTQQVGQAQQANTQLLNAANINSNPWLQGYGQSLGNLLLGQNAAEGQLASNQIQRNAQQLGSTMNNQMFDFGTQVMPQIRSDMIANGQYGSTRTGIAEGIAGARFANQLGQGWQNIINNAGASQDALGMQQTLRGLGAQNQIADLYKTGYGQGLQAVQGGINNVGTLQSASMFPAQVLGNVGAQEDTYAQNIANWSAQKALAEQNAPWAQLNNFANIVYGGANPTTTSQSIAPTTNPWAGAAGGAIAGAYAGSQIYPGYGTAIGAVVGALGGYFA